MKTTLNRYRHYNSLALRIKLSTGGIDAQKFSLHPFRKGAATFAADIGMDPVVLKAQGNWRSVCFQQYITRDLLYRHEFATQIVSALTQAR